MKKFLLLVLTLTVVNSGVIEPDSVLLEPESLEEHKVEAETSESLEEPVLEADYLIKEAPETQLEPESQSSDFKTDTDNLPVEEPVAELEPVPDAETKPETEKHVLKEEPTLEADYIVVEDPEEALDAGRERRVVTNRRWTCRGVFIQGKCYQFFTRTLNADAAELQCQKVCPYGHLASVTSNFIRVEMGKLMDRYGGRTRSWLGGRRKLGTNTFTWLDGARWTYNHWLSGEPNNVAGIEDCVEILSSLVFNDFPCYNQLPFFCSCPV